MVSEIEFSTRIECEEEVSETRKTLKSVNSSLMSQFRRVSGNNQDMQSLSSGTIQKVSFFLREENNDIYIPKLVSIGPNYHNASSNLRNMEDAKLKYLYDLIKRSPSTCLDTLIQVVQAKKDELMSEYSGLTNPNHEEFVKLMVVDGCFIIEFLIKWFLNEGKSQLKSLIMKLPTLKNDLLLMENQIPFYILDDLFKLFPDIQEFKDIIEKDNRYGGSYPSITFTEIALNFFMGDVKVVQPVAQKFCEDVVVFHHLLHLYHTLLNINLFKLEISVAESTMPDSSLVANPTMTDSSLDTIPDSTFHVLLSKVRAFIKEIMQIVALRIKKVSDMLIVRLNEGNQQQRWFTSGVPNACYLRDTGFKFKKKYALEYNFMDIFHRGTKIKIPILQVHENTQVNFKNLIAFEQCSPKYGNNFTAFATFLSHLIVSKEDVALLNECGIIDNRLGDDQKVADFFSNLCRGIYLDHDTHYLSSLFDYISNYYTESYYKVKFYRQFKKYIPDYFTKPCVIPRIILSAVLIAISLAQFIFTNFCYFHPSPRKHVQNFLIGAI